MRASSHADPFINYNNGEEKKMTKRGREERRVLFVHVRVDDPPFLVESSFSNQKPVLRSIARSAHKFNEMRVSGNAVQWLI